MPETEMPKRYEALKDKVDDTMKFVVNPNDEPLNPQREIEMRAVITAGFLAGG